jgi:hypothetical protein
MSKSNLGLEKEMLLSQFVHNKKIEDIEGELVADMGRPVFKVNAVIFDDGTQLQIEGDEGCYIENLPKSDFLDKQMKQIFDQHKLKTY